MDEAERQRRASEQEQRALQALDAIMKGGDLTEETMSLSNEFTDRQTARFSTWVHRARGMFRRRS
jgi:hypothetical protein